MFHFEHANFKQINFHEPLLTLIARRPFAIDGEDHLLVERAPTRASDPSRIQSLSNLNKCEPVHIPHGPNSRG